MHHSTKFEVNSSSGLRGVGEQTDRQTDGQTYIQTALQYYNIDDYECEDE